MLFRVLLFSMIYLVLWLTQSPHLTTVLVVGGLAAVFLAIASKAVSGRTNPTAGALLLVVLLLPTFWSHIHTDAVAKADDATGGIVCNIADDTICD